MQRLAEEQAALRRVATLVAEDAPPADVFAKVAEETASVIGEVDCAVARNEGDGTITTLAACGAGMLGTASTGERFPVDGTSVVARVLRDALPCRIDDYSTTTGTIAERGRANGIRSAVDCPVIVRSRIWGVIAVARYDAEPIVLGAEQRIAQFAELVATAIVNAESREALRRIAAEQAALRRVATLVAAGVAQEELFAAVAEDVGRLMSIDATRILRYETDDTATVVGTWSEGVEVPPELEIGAHLALEADTVTSRVYRSGRPARIDKDQVTGPLAAALRGLELPSGAGAPIVVEGRLWGVMVIGSLTGEPLRPGAEDRLAQFTELMATAIANADSRDQLRASRARFVTATDEARRRIERDLHDGVQQQLVSLSMKLRTKAADTPAGNELKEQLVSASDDLGTILDSLVEIARGIHPAILSKGGLQAALEVLASRSTVPVELNARIESPLPEAVDVAAYYVVSEALTNVAKYARASLVRVDVTTDDRVLTLAVRDDGSGGAVLGGGSGLVGLKDRVEALRGTVEVDSPPGRGTSVLATLPITAESVLQHERAIRAPHELDSPSSA